MAEKVIMPKQGLQMTEGTILKWLVKEGEACKQGEPLFEMETDKLTITIDASASGTLLKIVKGEGEVVPITELIAVIGNNGEDISSFLDQTEVKAASVQSEEPQTATAAEAPKAEAVERKTGERVFITPRAKMLAEEKNIDYTKVPASGPDGLIIEKDVLAYAASAPKATPLAKKLAGDRDLSGVQGTGERGKIVKADVENAFAAKLARAEAVGRTGKIVPFTGMRKVIAERMKLSQNTAAQTTHRVRVDMSEATRLRESLKAADKKISFNDIIAFAVCRALMEYPVVNSEITDEGILEKDYVNLGIAVAVDRGLIVPVIKDADIMSLAEISAATKELALKAKDGKLKPDEYKGGSFTISNLGMFGLDDFVAIINPPESGILAVGKIEKQAVIINDDIDIHPMMNLTLSYDHRVVDGAPAAKFLVRIKQLLENPYLML